MALVATGRPAGLAPPCLELQSPIQTNSPHHAIRFTRDGRALLTSGFDGHLHVWSAETEDYALRARAVVSRDAVLQLTELGGSEKIALASADGNAYVFDLESESLVATLRGHASYVNGCSASGATKLATASDDGTARIWDCRIEADSSASVVASSPQHKREVTAVVWSPTETHVLFLGSLDGGIRAYDERKLGAPAMRLSGHRDVVTGLDAHPDGTRLLSHGLDGDLIMWNVQPYSPSEEARRLFCVSRGASAETLSDRAYARCAFSSDGGRFSAGSDSASEYRVGVWESRKGKELQSLPGHRGTVIETAFHPFESVLASGGMDGRVLVGPI